MLLIVPAGCGHLLKEFSKILKAVFWYARVGVLVTLLLKTEVVRDMLPYRLINGYRAARHLTQTTWVIYTHGLQCEKWTELPSLCLQMNQQCKVCGEPAAGFHFGAFTCEGCKVRLQLEVWDCALGHSQDLFQAGWKQRTEMFVKEAFNALKALRLLYVPPV
jgi:hypothetical protein